MERSRMTTIPLPQVVEETLTPESLQHLMCKAPDTGGEGFRLSCMCKCNLFAPSLGRLALVHRPLVAVVTEEAERVDRGVGVVAAAAAAAALRGAYARLGGGVCVWCRRSAPQLGVH